MDLYVITTIRCAHIEEQSIYKDVDKAVQHMVCELYRIAEKIDIPYRCVKELEQKMWQLSREREPNHRYTFSYYDIYIKTFTVN